MVRFFAAAALGACASLGASAALAASSTVECAPNLAPKSPFKPDEFQKFRLINSRFESHDTRRFVFALDNPETRFYLPTASCVVAKYTDENGAEVQRPYTPVSVNGAKGHFELVVKRYAKSKMGTHLFQMRPGETLEIKGPYQKLEYHINKYTHIGMIAGGTGITPMYQIIRAVLDNDKDTTKIDLVYANNQRKDILMAAELCELQKIHERFHMYLTLAEAPKKWLGGVGFINAAMLKTFMPKPGEENSIVLVCGPPPMMKHVSGDKEFPKGSPPKQGELTGLLKEMGYTANQVFKF